MRERILGCPVDVLDMDTAVQALLGFVQARPQPPALIVTLNPEMVMHAQRDPEFAALLDHAALLVPDGVGIVNALRRRGHPVQQRVTGIDLLRAYGPHAARLGHRIALCGAAPGVAARAADELTREFPGLLVVASDSGDPGDAVAERLKAARPDVVCAAYGHGAQERFLAEHLTAIGAAAGIGVGGALDVLAGRVRRAPGAVQAAGFEWAWRLAREPRRLRRQAVLPVYWWRERREASRPH
ncbi:MAG TPA: WecB/TagA/CpsF family glycosyltransferase [Candidatus Angelobacter sp.]|jgi:N-acetylglucosaminyldiphosphoundecaprenol N-acetyl-beta-D-mannosaminyltransferase|nr:WecB/TagA/CpsF family glycosyltransferase [Candidatus Angelobacter sp.]